MKESNTGRTESSRITYETLAEVVRMKVQGFIQDILEEEVRYLFQRDKSERIKKDIDIPNGVIADKTKGVERKAA